MKSIFLDLDARSELTNFDETLDENCVHTVQCINAQGAQSVCLHFGKKNRRVENSFLPFFFF